MVSISGINTNNTILSPQKQVKKADNDVVQNQTPQGNQVYPSADLMKAMAGITQKTKSPEQEKTEEINKYLHSLPITGQVFSAYEQDEEGKLAVQGLVNAMSRNDVETSNVEMLIDLVENKKVNYSALLYLCKQGMMSDEFESDLDKLYDAHINNKDVKEAFVPTLKTTDEAVASQQIGDVFQIDGEDNIYIKTGDNETKQLKMSRNMYLKLFPPLERFALYQGDAGNCYMLSTLDAINSNPKTRERFLSCFEEEGENLKITLPGSDYTFTMDKHKMPAEIKANREQYSMGAVGFKLLEHVYGKTVQKDLLEEAHSILRNNAQNGKGILNKIRFKKQLQNFEKTLAENPDKIIFERNISDQSVSWDESTGVEFSILDENSPYKSAADYYRGRGGHEEWVMDKFGFTEHEKVFDIDTKNTEKLKEMLFNSDGSYIFTAGSAKKDEKLSGTEGLINQDYGVYSRHSFSVKPKTDKNGNLVLHVSNPWNTTQSAVISFEKFTELYSFVIAAKV